MLMNNFNLNLFKYFFYVVYFNGFSNTSRNLNIAQSALSYNVKQLEIQLQKQLIIRDNKNFQLTEDGANLFENLKPVFDFFENHLKEFNNNVEELTIGIRHYLSDFIFRDAIKEFVNKYPNIHLNIKMYSKLDLNKANNEYDIILDYDDYIDMLENVNIVHICALENIIVAGKKLSKAYESIKALKELDNVEMITMCPNRKNGKFQKLCFENGILVDNVISINDSELCKKLIIDDIGLCLINKVNVVKELASGEIKEIILKDDLFKDNVCLAYKNSTNLTNIKKFIDVLLNEYKEE